MNRIEKSWLLPQAILAVLFCVLVSPVYSAKSVPVNGKQLAIKLCQACHGFPGADQAGTVGPPFVSMSQRFPDRKRLRDIIHDPQQAINPYTMMPPFGRHGFLDNKQTDLLIDFLYTL